MEFSHTPQSKVYKRNPSPASQLPTAVFLFLAYLLPLTSYLLLLTSYFLPLTSYLLLLTSYFLLLTSYLLLLPSYFLLLISYPLPSKTAQKLFETTQFFHGCFYVSGFIFLYL